MSVKENIEFVKHEIGSEEKMLESLIKTETFYKKYKKFIFGFVLLVALVVGGFALKNSLQEQRIQNANTLYNKLQQAPNSDALKSELKSKDERLFNIFLFAQAIEHNNSKELQALIPYLPEEFAIAGEYQSAVLSSDKAALSRYLAKGDVPLKDLALLVEAYMLIQNQKIEDAKRSLAQISLNSPVKSIANALMHYTITQEVSK